MIEREINVLLAATALERLLPPCVLDQDASHSLRGCGEEMPAAGPVLRTAIHQSQIRFMNEGGRLKRVTVALLLHLSSSHSAKLVIDQGQQCRGRLRIAVIYRLNQPGDF